MILIVQYPNVPDSRRQEQYAYCLGRNMANANFEKVICLQEPGTILPAKVPCRMQLNGRLKYVEAMEASEMFPGQIIVLANADIYFDETLRHVTPDKLRGTVVCLSHDEAIGRTFEGQSAGRVTQDAWIFMAPLSVRPEMIDFELGRPGCENRFAYELLSAGYKLVNPSRLVRAYHVHVGAYGWSESQRIHPPYAFVPVTEGF